MWRFGIWNMSAVGMKTSGRSCGTADCDDDDEDDERKGGVK